MQNTRRKNDRVRYSWVNLTIGSSAKIPRICGVGGYSGGSGCICGKEDEDNDLFHGGDIGNDVDGFGTDNADNTEHFMESKVLDRDTHEFNVVSSHEYLVDDKQQQKMEVSVPDLNLLKFWVT